jgi:hypothetical protein
MHLQDQRINEREKRTLDGGYIGVSNMGLSPKYMAL